MRLSDIPDSIIIRETYTKRVEPFLGKPIVKVFTGQRRVGKSFVLYQIMQKILNDDPIANVIYINKEDGRFDAIRNYKDLSAYIEKEMVADQANYIFIDEIQEIDDFEKSVRSLQLNKKNDIYITGSNAQLLSGELATLLGGRTIEFNINSLSYSEFLVFHNLEDNDSNLGKYFLYGGMPFLVNLELSENIVFEYLRNIYTTIVFRDVIARHGLRNTYFLEQLIRYLSDNVGSLFSSKSISDFLKSQKVNISHNQVQAYTGFLTDAFLVQRVLRYDISGKRLFETGEKYYFEDIGIRNVLAGYKPDDKAKILENVVYNELLFRGYEVRSGWKGKRETDFIATKDNETTYIQVAWVLDSEATISREFGNLLEIKDNYPKMVITSDEKFRNTIKGVEHVNIRKFLMAH
ncbi:MAG: ATP-binding protein [Bacteroidia bacterium]|nr:MAG: ATP-binding protein [Bacteroidia bacterium]